MSWRCRSAGIKGVAYERSGVARASGHHYDREMRWWLALAVVGCGAGGDQARPPASTPTTLSNARSGSAATALALDCSPVPASGLAATSPADGGYRVLDDAGVAELHARIETGTRFKQQTNRAADALSAAVFDQRDAVAACFRAADPIDRNTQYLFRLSLNGTTGGTLVSNVDIQRVADVDPQGQPVLVPTRAQAQACVARLLQHLELPPSDWLSQLVFFVRADFCRARPTSEVPRPA